MKKTWMIIIAIVLTITIMGIFLNEKMIIENNNYKLKQAIANISKDEEVISINQIVPFDWDKLYSFVPYTRKEEIEKIIGIESNFITESINEGMINLVFVKDEKVVSNICSYVSKIGYEIIIPITSERYGMIKKIDDNKFKVGVSKNIITLTLSPSSSGFNLQDTLNTKFPKVFSFSSGAGAWRNELVLYADGTFKGIYTDSEMGESSESYPKGTVYISEYEGKFDIEKANDTFIDMKLNSIKTKLQEGKEYIEDEIRYVSSSPYGLEEGKEFILYLPNMPLKNLSEEFLSWWPGRYLDEEEKTDVLKCYGIFNKVKGYGFFTD